MPERDELQPRNAPETTADEAALAIVARHALHDEELVAALAAGALESEDDADERTRARGFVDRCPACRAVHDDVAAIVGATRAESRFTAKAPRDFRLSVDDAHRLGGTVITRGPLAVLGRILAGIARPMGASVAAIGLVGVLVGGAALGAGGIGGAASMAGPTSGGAESSSVPQAAPSTMEIALTSEAPKASERVAFDNSDAGSTRDSGPGPTGWLLIASVLAIIGGIGLFLWGSRVRRRNGAGAETP